MDLTPSEIVLIHGEQFAKPFKESFTLPSGVDVDSEELATAALQAAILANEKAAALRLEQETEKKLFGLMKSNVVRFRPAGGTPAWPAETLESRVLHLIREAGPGGVTVGGFFEALFPSEDMNPWRAVMKIVEGGLSGRGLAEPRSRTNKTLGVFKYEAHFVALTPAGEALAARHSAASVRDALSAAQRDRAALWTVLAKGIKAGFKDRWDEPDSGDD